MEILAFAALGVAVFASTNLDDIFVLMLFFTDRQFTPGQVILGQYAGIGLLILLSMAGSLAALFIPVQLLGLIPIALGVKKLVELLTSPAQQDVERTRYIASLQVNDSRDSIYAVRSIFAPRILSVAVVTLANGGDNVGIYTPLFATSTPLQILLLTGIFLGMTAVWCAASYFLIQKTFLGAYIRLFGERVMPFVLIGLGTWIVWSA